MFVVGLVKGALVNLGFEQSLTVTPTMKDSKLLLTVTVPFIN